MGMLNVYKMIVRAKLEIQKLNKANFYLYYLHVNVNNRVYTPGLMLYISRSSSYICIYRCVFYSSSLLLLVTATHKRKALRFNSFEG